jgi:hypothetical protein
MTSPETSNTKVSVNKLSFLLVTHTTYSDARFDSYRILKSGQGAEDFLDRLDIPTNGQVLRVEDTRNMARAVYKFRMALTQLSNANSYAHFW